MRPPSVVLAFLASLALACSSKTIVAAADGGKTTESGDPTVPSGQDPPTADAADAGVESGADAEDHGHSHGACVVKRVATSSMCSEDCGAQLLLPSGDYYCSTSCVTTQDCAELGANLICPETIGACVPRCTGNASCTMAGFQRCDTETGGCDTL